MFEPKFYNSFFINSKDKNNLTDPLNNFIIDSPNIYNIKAFSVKKVAFTKNYYNVQSQNSSFIVNYNGGGNVVKTIPTSNYDGVSLATALDTLLKTVDASFAVSYNTTTSKLTITATNNFVLDFTDYARTGYLLGFPASATTSTNSLVATYPINLEFTQTLNICSSALLEYGYSSHSSGRKISNILKKVYVNNVIDFGNITIVYDHPRLIPYHPNKQIPNIDIQIKDEYGELLDMNGAHIGIQLDLYR